MRVITNRNFYRFLNVYINNHFRFSQIYKINIHVFICFGLYFCYMCKSKFYVFNFNITNIHLL